VSLLRFTAAAVGVASAALYLLGWFLWDGSRLAALHPWAAFVPGAATTLLGCVVIWIRLWRLTTRTLPPGGPDLFQPRHSDQRFPGAWEAVLILGLMLFLAGWVAGRAVTVAGWCLLFAAGAQARLRVYEEPDPPG
jgi:hypothetical protein